MLVDTDRDFFMVFSSQLNGFVLATSNWFIHYRCFLLSVTVRVVSINSARLSAIFLIVCCETPGIRGFFCLGNCLALHTGCWDEQLLNWSCCFRMIRMPFIVLISLHDIIFCRWQFHEEEGIPYHCLTYCKDQRACRPRENEEKFC